MPITPGKIADTENALGFEFPVAFKAQMARRNGGEVEIDGEPWWLFPFRDNTSRKTLVRTAEDIKRATETARKDGLGFPSDGVAIGHNGAGDLLLLRRAGEVLGAEVWIFRLRGGELSRALDEVDDLWR